MFESLKGWIIDPNTQAQKTIENYENQRLSIEDAIESGLLNNRAGQIFLDYGDVVMGPAVKTPADIIVIRETVKGNSDSKEMQRTATAGFYAGFVGQGIEYTQIISNADYQLSMIITSAKGVNSINNPLSYLLFIKDFSLTQTLDAAKAGLQDVWNGTYDSAIGRRIGAGTFNYLLMTIGGAQLKGKGTACEAVESGSGSLNEETFTRYLADGRQVTDVTNLPGSTGIQMSRRLTTDEMTFLTQEYSVEFAQVYRYGNGVNGGGGQYYLYSGTIDRVTVPIGNDIMLINHTHPGGTASPSSADKLLLGRYQQLGSPQRSSEIIPIGKENIRFNTTGLIRGE